MEFELPKINVSFEYDEEKDEIVFVINGVEKRVKTEDMITEMEKLQEQNTALEQESCEDCISRVLQRMWNYRGKQALIIDKITMERIIREELPSIQPKPKAGHWIDHQEDRWIYAMCSECRTVHDTRTNYCPNCGAKMLPTDLQFADQDTLMSAT